jgi:hypothetical protein
MGHVEVIGFELAHEHFRIDQILGTAERDNIDSFGFE